MRAEHVLGVSLSLGLRTTVKLVVRLVAVAFLFCGGVPGVVRSLPITSEYRIWRRRAGAQVLTVLS